MYHIKHSSGEKSRVLIRRKNSRWQDYEHLGLARVLCSRAVSVDELGDNGDK
jgi:hypothetical protein